MPTRILVNATPNNIHILRMDAESLVELAESKTDFSYRVRNRAELEREYGGIEFIPAAIRSMMDAEGGLVEYTDLHGHDIQSPQDRAPTETDLAAHWIEKALPNHKLFADMPAVEAWLATLSDADQAPLREAWDRFKQKQASGELATGGHWDYLMITAAPGAIAFQLLDTQALIELAEKRTGFDYVSLGREALEREFGGEAFVPPVFQSILASGNHVIEYEDLHGHTVRADPDEAPPPQDLAARWLEHDLKLVKVVTNIADAEQWIQNHHGPAKEELLAAWSKEKPFLSA
ncbi:hypothetical protein Mmc1_3407 [Magnetococcus marinus MC-1]|uniref:Uncharacterized protein n=1 Tax=Magnetococcus marinus (strain ATCC BAA-1437 / JCM 17883 / MC-1) TaxID=156889 RepID=A0LD50_MAGMM|nr:hypothetical protein [Magnetococcus marinus]ABK45893.1 hypothetical protein Mmc1_3407 [Magnetococcus marinus MC-1]